MKQRPSVDYVRSLFKYDPDHGVLIWNTQRRGVWLGQRAGRPNKKGYWSVGVDYKRYELSHVIWAIVYGEWPTHEIDHRDVNPSNNRIDNLRKATRSNNHMNKTTGNKNKACPLKGAYLDKRNGHWFAQIMINRKAKRLGTFMTAEEAHGAYVMAAREMFGEFARAA